ncbi:uncharacterized protein BBOV_IV004880 [Babesia bovis T2Bo]|uniref:Uncharacterized protein n=1 Tax=Babesia bovis TaxID=5865 RepID=A7AQN0_BABBO|nr:uncharacterized protein BBOV_IV004880 [Babesia bovis T2Bo]EDO06849.1 hypothetical protein BBOV_IV004880 [Babesia bovis T2Bo]BAN64815.1 hypothetical protein [Babesia bovis]|eukprot:XP_001610417.1 hypothetical protein [Babesia bovis T2Bo]
MYPLESNSEQLPAAGLPVNRIHREHRILRPTGIKPKEHILPGWEFTDDASSNRTGRRMFGNGAFASSGLLDDSHVSAGNGAQLHPHRKKQPDISEEMRTRLFGIPGQNIFTYELDKPKACILPQTNIDVGMVPKDGSELVGSPIRRTNLALKSSLDGSLLPKEECNRPSSRQLFVEAKYESHIEPGYVTPDAPLKTVRLSNMKHNTSLEPGLLPSVKAPVSTRRHYNFSNAHCYDFLSGE